MSKLFELNKHGDTVCSDELIEFKQAKEHVEALQSKKAMYQTWKIDIFIDTSCFALCVMNILQSAAYKKGIFEWGISVLRIRYKGCPDLEHVGDTHLASFPTPEAAFVSIGYVQTYIRHRYNLELEIKKEIRYEA